MKKTKKTLKVFFKNISVISLLSIFVLQPFFALAASPINYIGPDTGYASKTGAPFILTPNSGYTEGAAMQNKNSMPSIRVIFDKTPVVGEKVTATALQVGFDVNNKKDLYYTWYIKHKNGSVDVEDWKKEAAEIITRGSFEKNDINNYKNLTENVSDKGYLASPAWGIHEEADSQNCYMQSYQTGRLYEFSSVKNQYNCPKGYTPLCISKDSVEFKENQFGGTPTAGNDNSYPANSICTFNDPAYCSTPPDPLPIPPALNCNQKASFPDVLVNKINTPVAGPNDSPTCETVDNENFNSQAICEQVSNSELVFEAKCVKGSGVSVPYNATQAVACQKLKQLLPTATKTSSTTGDFVNSYEIGAPLIYDLQKSPEPLKRDDGTEIEDPDGKVKCFKISNGNRCEHIFPKSATGEKLGDGKYNIKEEKYWGTNPNIKSTAGNGKVDEANLIGLDMNKFTWDYQEGDQIGVAIEGSTGDPTKHDDSSFVITWAFSKNVCSAFDDYVAGITPGDEKYYAEQAKTETGEQTTGTGIITVDPSKNEFSMNDCLKENLIDPKEGGNEQLSIRLSYKPKTPKNMKPDSNGNSNGDLVDVIATITNAGADISGYNFNWSVEKSNNGTANPVEDENSSGWITTNAFTNNSPQKGVGNNNFSFKLDANTSDIFPEIRAGVYKEDAYIRVKVVVTENGGANRTGKGTAIVNIINTGRNIIPYTTKIDSGKLKMVDTNIGAICLEGDVKKPCNSPIAVIKDEIIGFKISDESNISQIIWKKDGKNITCDATISPDCSSGSLKQFIPITGVEGTIFEITATTKMNNADALQNFSRKFIIVKPSVEIISANENAWEKITGYKKDLNGNILPVSSSSILKTYFGKEVTLKASFYPQFIENDANYEWSKDGEIDHTLDKIDSTTQTNMKLTTSEEAGKIYNIGLSAVYSQSLEKRKALQDIWGISAFDSREARMSSLIQVEATNEEIPLLEASAARNFFASIILNVSKQTIFMLRVMLSGTILLVSTWAIFVIMPGASGFRRREF
jgi:hypothetical protein